MTRVRLSVVATVIVGGAVVSLWPSEALAQAGGARRWTVEVTGGVNRPFDVGGGDVTLPPRGAPIPTLSPTTPSRQVPTWFLGDGANLLNLVNEQFGVPAAIVPLDAALARSGDRDGLSGAFGVRVRRQVTARYAVHVGIDVMPGAAGAPDELVEAAAAAAGSFESAFEGLFASGPFANVAVDASTSGREGSGRELALTGAVEYAFAPAGGIEPYMTLGGGVITGFGDPASVSLDGRYQATIIGEGAQVPLDERDRLTVSYDYRTALVGVVGAGFRRAVSSGWGVVVDGRVFFGQHASRVVLDSDPEVAVLTPADFIESGTTPSVVFANNPSTGRVSSLGAPGLDGFEAFAGNGLQVRAIISAGVFFRF